MRRITGGACVASVLRDHGVKTIFSLPGVGVFPIYEACDRAGIRVISGRHEQAVVLMAEGDARVSGAPAVAVLPEGPGHANGISGLATAFAEFSPVLMLSASDELRNLGRGGLQELPQVEMARPVSKWAACISDPRHLADGLHRAFHIASHGVPGPVHLTLTADALEGTLPEEDSHAVAPPAEPPVAPDPAFVERALDVLAAARRPAIVAGSATYWSHAGPALQALVETAGLPLFTVERARGLISDEHPLCFGDAYTTVNPAAEALHHADAVLLLGERIDCRFGYGCSFASATLIHVQPALGPGSACHRSPLVATADAGRVADALARAAVGRDWSRHAAWVESLCASRARQREDTRRLAADGGEPLHPLRLAAELEPLLPEDAILVFDGGDCSGWFRLLLRARSSGGWQTGTILGQVGTGLPYAIGARCAAPARPVVLLTGDGSMGFSPAELETAVRHGLPLVIVIANDAAWGIEEHFQSCWFPPGRHVATRLGDTRWDRVAEAMGAWGVRVERAGDLRPALEQALAAGRPACVDVRTRSAPSHVADTFTRVFTRRRTRLGRGP